MDYAAFVSYVLLMVFAPGANTITAMSGASRGGFMGVEYNQVRKKEAVEE